MYYNDNDQVVTFDVPCIKCSSLNIGVDAEPSQLLFGCLECGVQWAAPIDDPRAVVLGSVWALSLKPPRKYARRRG